MKKLILLIFSLSLIDQLRAQDSSKQDTQFPKGWELQLKLTSGMVTNFHGNAPDMYAGALGLSPQYAVIPHKLRLGATALAVYNNKKVSGLFGPSAALKLKSLETKLFGIGNIQLLAEHLWGTDKQRLVGGGPYIELGHKLLIGITAHRDYNLNSWWFQSAIAIRLNKGKTDQQEFNQPTPRP